MNKELKHTPGPWEVMDGRRVSVVLPNQTAGGYDSHCVALTYSLDARVNAAANARLIAAAPAMAAALNRIAGRLQMDVDDGSRPDQWSMEDMIRVAKAALPEDQR